MGLHFDASVMKTNSSNANGNMIVDDNYEGCASSVFDLDY